MVFLAKVAFLAPSLLQQCRYMIYINSITDSLIFLFPYILLNNLTIASNFISLLVAPSAVRTHAEHAFSTWSTFTSAAYYIFFFSHHRRFPTSLSHTSYVLRLEHLSLFHLILSYLCVSVQRFLCRLQSYRGHRLQRHPGRCWHQLCRPCSCRPPRSRTWPFPSI